MEHSFKKIFWGFLITIFNINIGPINLLPDFLGYLIISSGLKELSSVAGSKNYIKASKAANFLVFYSIVSYIAFNMVNYDYSYNMILENGVTVLGGSIKLFMCFYILSGAIEYFLSVNKENLAEKTSSSQKKFTLLQIICLLINCAYINISNEVFAAAAVIAMLGVQIYFASIISKLSKLINEDIMEI